MIQNSTILNVVDNSGAKTAICIKVGKGFNKRYAVAGDIILVSIKTLRHKRKSQAKVLKGDICKALVLRTKTKINYLKNTDNFSFLENSVILLNLQKKFLFSRIFGPVPYFLRYSKFMKIISVASGVIY